MCTYDRVMIYDSSAVMTRLCGEVTLGGPAFYMSSSNMVRIVFTSDVSVQSSGFTLQYNMIRTDAGNMFHIIFNEFDQMHQWLLVHIMNKE